MIFLIHLQQQKLTKMAQNCKSDHQKFQEPCIFQIPFTRIQKFKNIQNPQTLTIINEIRLYTNLYGFLIFPYQNQSLKMDKK